MKLSPAEGLSSSRAVFAAVVTDIQPNTATRFGGLEVTLRVEQVWKGAPEETTKVHTAGTGAACGYPFVEGKTYLVYVVHDDADPMRVSLCSRTTPLDKAKEDLDFLGKPSHRFAESGADGRNRHAGTKSKGGCAAASGRPGQTGLALFALMLLAGAITRRRLIS